MNNNFDWSKIKFMPRSDNAYYPNMRREIYYSSPELPTSKNLTYWFHPSLKWDVFSVPPHYCSLLQFDWINENGECVNSNIPNIEDYSIKGDYIIMDKSTKKMYNWLLNEEIYSEEQVQDLLNKMKLATKD
jgi:hypothetical protein